MAQKKLPLINSSHGSETRNIINELIKLFNGMGYTYNESLKMMIELLEDYDGVQKQLDNLVIESGNSNAEVSQARGDFDLLYKRLDSYNKRFEQTDYVELIEKYNDFGNIQLFKLNDSMFEVSVFNDVQHLTYQFQVIANDDFIIQTRIWTGGVSNLVAKLRGHNVTNFILDGTYNDPGPSAAYYAMDVGSTFEYTFDTNDKEALQLRMFKHGTGGVWRIYLDGSHIKDVSTYAASSKYEMEFISSVGMGSHVIKGEFIGDDPKHTPSSGAGSSRGWLASNTSDFLEIGNLAITPSKDVTLVEPSNKEFALNIKPQEGIEYQFVPFHAFKTSFEASPKIWRNGSMPLDFKNIAPSTTVLLDGFSFEQHIYGRHPESGSRNLLDITFTHSFDKKTGMMSFDGKATTLEAVNFKNSYVIMGTATGSLFDKVITSFGNEYSTITPAEATNIPMAEERDWAKSYAYISSQNKTYAVAFRVNNIRETFRQGTFGKDDNPDRMTYINNRSEDLIKIYSRLFNEHLVPPGHTIRFSGDYIYSTNANFHDLFSL